MDVSVWNKLDWLIDWNVISARSQQNTSTNTQTYYTKAFLFYSVREIGGEDFAAVIQRCVLLHC